MRIYYFLIGLICLTGARSQGVNQPITVFNLDKFCADSVCKGLFYGTFEKIIFDQTKKFPYTTVTFTNSSFPIIPMHLFRVFQSIKDLYMPHCYIKKLERVNFDAGHNLRLLDLSYNQITDIPNDSLANLRALMNLTIRHNGLRTLNVNSFNGLTNLKNLTLDHNEITTLPLNVFQFSRQLDYIDLSYNKLESADVNCFKVLQALKTLILQGNNFKIIDVNIVKIPDALLFMYKTFVNVSTVTTNEFLTIQNGNLNHLDLSRNYLGYLPVGAFISMTKLKALNLSATNLFYIETGALSHHAYLETLDLSENHLHVIPSELILPMKSLKVLYIDDNGLTSIQYEHWMTFINLTEIGIGSNPWNCAYLKDLVSVIQKYNCSLRRNSRFELAEVYLNTTPNVARIYCFNSERNVIDNTMTTTTQTTSTTRILAPPIVNAHRGIPITTQRTTTSITTTTPAAPTVPYWRVIEHTTPKVEPPNVCNPKGLFDYSLNIYTLLILLIITVHVLFHICKFYAKPRVMYKTGSPTQELTDRFM